jgi:ribonuclease III
MPDIRPEQVRALEEALGFVFQDRKILTEALTHSSYVNENPGAACNERLEYLGDAVLGLVLAEKLYRDYPKQPEGDLTRLRARLAQRSTLAHLSATLHLGSYLRMGRGEGAGGGSEKPANLAGAFEALLGAVFVDAGWEAVKDCLLRLLAPEIAQLQREEFAPDYKSRLQEAAQLRFKITPNYTILSESGPVHDRQFTAAVLVGENTLAEGNGRSKKLAEAEAARLALEKLGETFTE